MATKSNQIVPDFTEDLVSFMVQMMLTVLVFPRVPFAIIPLSKKEERLTGADVKIEAIAPIYFQFKRSFAYPDSSRSKIISQRKTLKLDVAPQCLFFELRKKDPSHMDLQHNLLYDLRQSLLSAGIGNATYVAPLFLNRSAYLLAAHLSSIRAWRPWNFLIRHPFQHRHVDIATSSGAIRFQDCPVLKEHVAIPPHNKVTSEKHKYSYLQSGGSVCFHSPEHVDHVSNLGQFMYEYLNFKDGQPSAGLIYLAESTGLLKSLSSIAFASSSVADNRSVFDSWLEFGHNLREVYGIEQYMLIRFKDDVI